MVSMQAAQTPLALRDAAARGHASDDEEGGGDATAAARGRALAGMRGRGLAGHDDEEGVQLGSPDGSVEVSARPVCSASRDTWLPVPWGRCQSPEASPENVCQ